MGYRFGAILLALVIIGSEAKAAEWEALNMNDKVVLSYDKSSIRRSPNTGHSSCLSSASVSPAPPR
jgi:hypothetical protein